MNGRPGIYRSWWEVLYWLGVTIIVGFFLALVVLLVVDSVRGAPPAPEVNLPPATAASVQ